MSDQNTKWEVINHLDGSYRNMIAQDITQGLSSKQRRIPSKYFYDAQGSKLFEDICKLPEYYPTRTEMQILKENAPNIMYGFTNHDLVELGAGADWKVRVLLDAVPEENRTTLRYLSVDISEAAVIEASRQLAQDYPEVDVIGVVADFTSQLSKLPNHRPRMYCFLGGTIGNMRRKEAVAFLHEIAHSMNSGDKLLIGFDMLKSHDILEAAYNDSQGITEQFNKNILSVVNKGLNGNFKQEHFNHVAYFNPDLSRIEMHLQVNQETSVVIEDIDLILDFQTGETIHTENSHKFTRDMISELAREARLYIQDWYTDPKNWFSLVLMTTL